MANQYTVAKKKAAAHPQKEAIKKSLNKKKVGIDWNQITNMGDFEGSKEGFASTTTPVQLVKTEDLTELTVKTILDLLAAFNIRDQSIIIYEILDAYFTASNNETKMLEEQLTSTTDSRDFLFKSFNCFIGELQSNSSNLSKR